MKKYQVISILTSIILIITAILVGCTSEAQAFDVDDFRIKEVRYLDNSWYSGIHGNLVVDTQTGVEYWYIKPLGDSGGYSLTLLVDQDGKPLIWKGE